MKRLLTLLMLLWAAACAVAVEIADVPNVHVADRNRYVTDQAGILSPQTVARLDSVLGALWRQTTAEFVVVTVDRVPENTDVDTYATELFEHWGIGKGSNDNGLLLLISRDDRKAAVRTGYGMEGTVPDIVAGRVIRQQMTPRFRQGDYDGGTLAAVGKLGAIIQDPRLAGELRGTAQPRGQGEGDFWSLYLWFAFIAACGMMVWVMVEIVSTRRLNEVIRYRRLNTWSMPAAVLAAATLGMGLLPWGLLRWKMHRLRRHARRCPECHVKMKLLDEQTDNLYLTHAQDMEEQLGSVDYDVWLCPKCQRTEALPYPNPRTPYTDCERCGAKAVTLVDRQTLRRATTRTGGVDRYTYMCRNCGNQTHRDQPTPKLPDPALAAAAAAAALGSRGSGGFGGGGGGGSFGGGSTGGGGASGGW